MRKRKKKYHKKKYQQTERVKERKKRIRVGVRDKMKTLEKRKKEKQQFIRNMYWEEIQKYKNEKIKKNTKIHQKSKRVISQEYQSTY